MEKAHVKKLLWICKNSISTTVKREQDRYTLYISTINGISYNIVGLHLPANPFSDSNDRKEIIRELVQDIIELENKQKCRNTIVIGDFNCNPFDEEIIQKDAFNAVLFKSLIKKQETVRHNNRTKRRFFNPILHYISEDSKTYGSYYYSAGNAILYWNCFDQILVRRELIENIESLRYLKSIKGKSLMVEVKPNDRISDHLPLLVKFQNGD